jgi:hypothetical protein
MSKFNLRNLTKKQKIVAIIASVLVVGIGLAIFLVTKNKQSNAEPPVVVKKKVQSPVNVIPVSERPYLRLEPNADGRYITINVLEVKKPATELEYEMEYQTGSMLQGFGGLINIAKLPATEKKLFGSQSAGGAITYHEDIKGGNLLAQFSGNEAYAVKSAWRYFENTKEKMSKFTSQDNKFSIEAKTLSSSNYLVIYNSPGYPGEVEGELLSDPYVVSAERQLASASNLFTISFRSSDEAAKIMGYDGSNWQEMESEAAEGLVSASGPFMEVYLLVK